MARGKSPCNMVQYIANFPLTIARKIPAVVTPVLDGVSCHHFKKASTQQVAQCKKSGIKSAVARYSALALSSKLDREEGIEEERRMDRARLEELNKKSLRLEKASAVQIPTNFSNLLREKLFQLSAHDVNDKGGHLCEPIIAILQADALSAY
eukprot:15365700-Ditylum_brightwellii.AAC.1